MAVRERNFCKGGKPPGSFGVVCLPHMGSAGPSLIFRATLKKAKIALAYQLRAKMPAPLFEAANMGF